MPLSGHLSISMAPAWYGIDWYKVVTDLAVVYTNFPNMMDNGKQTASERYRIALAGVGDNLSAKKNGAKQCLITCNPCRLAKMEKW